MNDLEYCYYFLEDRLYEFMDFLAYSIIFDSEEFILEYGGLK